MARSKKDIAAEKRKEERDRRRKEERDRKREERKKREAEAYRQYLATVVSTEVAAEARFNPVTFDRDAQASLERFSNSVLATFGEYVDTSRSASELGVQELIDAVDPELRNRPFYFLLTGQLSFSDVEEWTPKNYETGAKVRYLGEVYYAVNTITGTEPPVKTYTSDLVYRREENPDWAPIGRSENLTNPARRVTNPDFGFVNGQWQYGTQGDTWLVTATPGKNEIFIWDFGGQQKALSPNTTYQVGKVENSPSWISGTDFPRNLTLFPPGTTFTTNDTLTPPYATTQPCIVPRSTRTLDGKSVADMGIISQIYITTQPVFNGVMSGLGGENGIYKYDRHDAPLQRLNAHDGTMSAPLDYGYLIVREDNLVSDAEKRVQKIWVSDDQNNWAESESGILIGKYYGENDIPSVYWRSKDASVGEQPSEWAPQTVYYPNDRVMFGGLEYAFNISDQLGFANIAPMDSDFWVETADPLSVLLWSRIDAYRINTITLEDFELPVRLFALAIPDKAVTLSTLPADNLGKISFEVDGEYGFVYASSFSTPRSFSSRIYRTSAPLTFTLNPSGLDVFKVRWDFGDGTNIEVSDGLSVSHTYSIGSLSPIPMKVTVKVTDVNGVVYRTSRRINLQKTDVGVAGLPIVVD